MARDPYYEPEEESGRSPQKLFLIILAVLMLALIILCVVLTLRLRSSKTEVADLKDKLAATEQNSSSLWNYADPGAQTGTPASSTPENTPAPESSPELTPVPTVAPTATPEPTPTPTATPEPVVSEPGGLPSWISENDLRYLLKRPADDEWYSAPGKLYVTAELGLRMRSGPSGEYGLITVIPYKSEVTVYAGHGDWRLVKDSKGNVGWASSKLMTTEGTSSESPTPSPAAPSTAPETDPEPTPSPEAPSVSG